MWCGVLRLQVFVGRLMDEVCKSSLYHCRSQVIPRGAISVFVKDQEENVGTALQWKCETKHDFPMSLAVGAPEDAKVSHPLCMSTGKRRQVRNDQRMP
jgi:hypothetical protein